MSEARLRSACWSASRSGPRLRAGCVRYIPAPISPGETLGYFEARSLDAPELRLHLERLGVEADEIPGQWDLRRLTLAAFYYSPALDVARAEWAVARGGVITAGSRPGPTVGAAVGYNTTTPTAEVTPWIIDAALDIPVDVAGRRGIRIAQARQLSEAARLNVLSAAWQVRSRVRRAFLILDTARRAAPLLDALQENQAGIVRILEYRRSAGDISPYEVSQARIALANGRAAALENRQRQARALSELADAVGVPPAALRRQIAELKRELPPDMKLAFFYDQAALRPAGQRVPSADGRGRFRDRLLHPAGDQPRRDRPPAAPGRGDPALGPGG